MARNAAACALGLPHPVNYLEAEPLKLAAEHFPLPGSLLALVVLRYADSSLAASGKQAMDLAEVAGYLRGTGDLTFPPLQSIRAQTEAIGDPALPIREQMAILQWLSTAFDDWEQQYPLEEPLRSQLRRLQPLAATLAITDPDFLVPGGHLLHLLLDSLQLVAVGWQARLGRAGNALERRLVKAVDDALALLDTEETDLAELSALVIAANDRDLTRASRMMQRVIETELGRIKTAEARRTAAEMINAALREFQAPPSIARFLKNDWYASAQLVLLKFGARSEQWKQMTAITATLLDSVQYPEEEEDAGRRQRLFQTVTQLPRDLRRWLLSLQHDAEAIGNAMGVVEYAHVQILRKSPLELEQSELIPVTVSRGASAAHEALTSITAGQWFQLEHDDTGPVRVQLVLKIEREGELHFANQAGIKVLQMSYNTFATLLQRNKASTLDSGLSFSRCLARAAGIHSPADLDLLMSDAVSQAKLQAEQEEEKRLHLHLDLLEAEKLQRQQMATDQENGNGKTKEPSLQPPPISVAPENPKLINVVPAHPAATPGLTLVDQAEILQKAATLTLPMGAWLGFHDGVTPLLAKLAVHDRENDHFIFVNRSGIKMRQLNGQELVLLIDKGLVDILESRSNFRDDIIRAKKNLKNKGR